MRINIVTTGLMMMAVGASYAEMTDVQKRKAVTSQYYVDTAVETKQPVIGAESGNYVVLYPNSAGTDQNHNDAGEINKRHVSATLTVGNNGGDGVNAATTDIPTVGAVNTGLNRKQNKLSGTSGKLVTYGGAEGVVGAADIYDESGAYSTQTDALVNASQVNGAVANGFSELLTCREYADGHDGDMDYCLLYIVNTDMTSGVYVPQN